MNLIDRLKSLWGTRPPASSAAPVSPLDYDQAIFLDAESLAEQGILSAYRELFPRLEKHSAPPLEVIETFSNDGLGYTVAAGGRQFVIWEVLAGGQQNSDGWERATVAFFQIVNASLEASTHRFYAINGGNDLFGMFLTEQEAAAAGKQLPGVRTGLGRRMTVCRTTVFLSQMRSKASKQNAAPHSLALSFQDCVAAFTGMNKVFNNAPAWAFSTRLRPAFFAIYIA